MRRSFVLGLIGGLIGMFMAFLVYLFVGVVSFFSTRDISSSISIGATFAVATFLGSVLAIVGSVLKRKVGGAIMIVASVIVLVGGLFLLGVIPFVLILIGGILAIREKPTLQSIQTPMQAAQTSTPGAVASSPSKFCSNCGKELRANVKFCPSCGAAVHA